MKGKLGYNWNSGEVEESSKSLSTAKNSRPNRDNGRVVTRKNTRLWCYKWTKHGEDFCSLETTP